MDSVVIWQWEMMWIGNSGDLSVEGPFPVFLPLGLYGVYMAVFSLSMWTMCGDEKRVSGTRWVVVVTFVAVTLYIASIIIGPSLDLSNPNVSLHRFAKVTDAWRSMSAYICCSLSDSVLAWRCYVIFGKPRWLKWTLTIVIFVIAVSGICSTLLNLLIDFEIYDEGAFKKLLQLMASVSFPTILTWAVCSLVLNTVVSTSIVVKIVIVSRQTSKHFASSRSIPLVRAFIESSLMSWIALAVFTGVYISWDLLPNSAVVRQGQNALFNILPLIFSISQALVIARLGVVRFAASTSFKDTIVALTSDDHDASAPRSRAVAWRDVETWSDYE